MNTHLLFMATANHARHEGARLLANIDAEQLSDTAIKSTVAIANEFRVASALATAPGRQTQLLERVRVCLDVLADVEEDLMQAAGER
jgi:hypothetical protein